MAAALPAASLDFIRAEFEHDPHVSASSIARKLGVSRSTVTNRLAAMGLREKGVSRVEQPNYDRDLLQELRRHHPKHEDLSTAQLGRPVWIGREAVA